MNDAQFQTASKIVQLGNAVTYYRNQKMQEFGLTSIQGDAIRTILHHPGITAVEMKKLLGLSQSTMAGILARLEEKGFIQRRTDDADGRKQILMPAQLGLKLEGILKETAVETQNCITAGMSDAQKAEFDRLLQIALNNMSAARIRR